MSQILKTEKNSKFVKRTLMALKPEDLENRPEFRLLSVLEYNNLIPFIISNLKRITEVTVFFWSSCIILLVFSLKIRFSLFGFYGFPEVLPHTLLALIILPLAIIPIHEVLHIFPYFLGGARKIRIGMDLRQYLFYVTAHRFVASPLLFRIVALVPFITITAALLLLIWYLPGLWKWSLSLFLFVHTTMCAGDFALINFYHINRPKKIFTWDDADAGIAYFYEQTDL